MFQLYGGFDYPFWLFPAIVLIGVGVAFFPAVITGVACAMRMRRVTVWFGLLMGIGAGTVSALLGNLIVAATGGSYDHVWLVWFSPLRALDGQRSLHPNFWFLPTAGLVGALSAWIFCFVRDQGR